MFRKNRILISSILLALLLAFYYLGGINVVKRLVGYNTPVITDFPPIGSNGELGFLIVPEGFEISIAAKELSNPRVILFDSRGRILVSETKSGRVSVLEDKNKDGDFENKYTLIDGLKSPHGLDIIEYKGVLYLYIAETHQVARYPYDINTGQLTSMEGENMAFIPADGRHFTRTIAFGPNFREKPILGLATIDPIKLYISVGSSCDVCEESTWKRAAILESDVRGSFTAEFAGGLRNSVFFTFHPKTGEIWATEMGRDGLGDNLPPDEINIVKVAGSEHEFGARRYGWPFCYGNQVTDGTFKLDKTKRIDIPTDCSQTDAPVIEIQAHSSPLGLAFIDSDNWPKEWQGDLLVAFHGSWNRKEPVGYKIVRYDLDANGNVLSQEPLSFISGWLSDDKKNIFGRPVDLKFDSNGVLYISDDAAGLIYRINPIN